MSCRPSEIMLALSITLLACQKINSDDTLMTDTNVNNTLARMQYYTGSETRFNEWLPVCYLYEPQFEATKVDGLVYIYLNIIKIGTGIM